MWLRNFADALRVLTAQISPGVGMHAQEQFSIRCTLLPLAIAVVASVGCGAKTDRLPLSGSVTLDSLPLDNGSIHFTSIDSEKLIATGAPIEDGEFRIPGDKGLPPGTYALEISAADPHIPPGALTATERIPAEYNVNSKQTIEISQEGDNHFVFEILTKSR